MTTINLKKRGVELALAIRAERQRCFEQASAIQKEAQEQMSALTIESQVKMKGLWMELMAAEGLDPEEYDRWAVT